MYATEARNIYAFLGVLAGDVKEEQWAVIQQARESIRGLADKLDKLEKTPVGALIGKEPV